MAPPARRSWPPGPCGSASRGKGPMHFILPKAGIEAWDPPGEAAHHPEGQTACIAETEREMAGRVDRTVLDSHINDAPFCDTALAQLDARVAAGVVIPGKVTA
ncbi:hypothetical protein [Roseinatronobacter alkalisoli]|uniref:hypothetical protein n=1 Tax=Roseinatronobacter alkalisoli TaxID=3028235 RepID=UPI003B681C66